jgi:hypothetical protein
LVGGCYGEGYAKRLDGRNERFVMVFFPTTSSSRVTWR